MNLDLYLHGQRVAKTTPRSRGKKFVIEYTEAALDGTPDESIMLSCSLPTPGPSGPMNAWAYLDGLLPEGQALETMAARIRGTRLTADGSTAEPTDTINLLATYGRECAGAVAAVRDGESPPGEGSYRPLNRHQIAELIANLPENPLGTDPDSDVRMSLAGNQPKLLLARFGDDWYAPTGGSATTHILKPTGLWPLSADNEAIVMGIARSVGLTSSATWVDEIGGTRTLVAERFDRIVADRTAKTVHRRHQEDMCQALGLRPRQKYQIGRPSGKMARLLRQVPTAAGTNARQLFKQFAFRAIVGDEDGHGKNYGVIIEHGQVSLSPLYDSLTTLVYPRLTGKMGAQIGHQHNLTKVDLDALVEEGLACGISAEESRQITADLAQNIKQALDGPHHDTDAHALDVVTRTIAARVDRLIRGKPMGAAPAGTALMTTPATGATMDQATRAGTSR